MPPGSVRRRRAAPVARGPFPGLVLLLLFFAGIASPARAAGNGTLPGAGGRLAGIDLLLADESLYEDGTWVFRGNVEIHAGPVRILADEVRGREEEGGKGLVEATGNVVLTIPGAVLSGSRLAWRLDSATGRIEDVVGYLEKAGAILRAKVVEKIDAERLRVEDAVFTTCTQPVPYWSFRIHRGTFHLGEYAYLHSVAFKAGRVPVFWSPYLVWPIKTDRASGLLFPEFHSSDKLGESLSIPFYWAFADNADVTFTLDTHSRVGLALGAELRWLPTWKGRARGRGYWIDDRVRHRTRYSFEWKQRQRLPWDVDLRADIQVISDFDYVTDYETDLVRAALPQTLSTVDLTRHWSWYSLSLRMRRHKQYFVGGIGLVKFLTGQVVNDILPELEWRARNHRLGHSPFFLSFEGSVVRFRKKILVPPEGRFGVGSEDDLVTDRDDAWTRLDFAPRLTVPLLKSPWADLSLRAGWRGTWYSARRDPADPEAITSRGLTRVLWDAGFTFSGPRFQRIFETPGWGYTPRLKHVIEPFLAYSWRPEAGIERGEIPVVDEVDTVPGRLSDLTWGIRQRLYALRPPRSGRVVGIASVRETSFDEIEKEEERDRKRREGRAREPGFEEEIAVENRLGPVEIASLEIYQSYSFVRDLNRVWAVLVDPLTGQVEKDPRTGRPRTVLAGTRAVSPVTVRLRFNPDEEHVVTASYVFDPANSVLTETSVSALFRLARGGYFNGSWYRRQPANPAFSDPTSFLRARFGMIAPSRRFGLEVDWDYDLEAGSLDHQGYRVRYATQCCTFRLGYDRRDFVDNSRREFMLTVDLAGIGRLLDLRQSQHR